MEIIELGTVGNTKYGIRFIVCENDETVADRLEVGDAWRSEAANEICRDIHDAISRATPGFVTAEGDSNFQNWHGGKYSHQAKMYGYTTTGWGCYAIYSADLLEADEDHEEEFGDWERCSAEVPAEIQSVIDRIVAAAGEAANAAVKSVEAKWGDKSEAEA